MSITAPTHPVLYGEKQSYQFRDDLPQEAKDHLHKSAEWATHLLEKLTGSDCADKMPAGVLASCEGLALLSVSKGGFGLTLAGGHGFILRKMLHDAHGHALWSPPVFVKVSQVGFGVAAGYEHVDSAVALMNLATVDRFVEKHKIGGADLGLFSTAAPVSGAPAGTYGSMQQLEVAADGDTAAFCYSLSSGVLVNLSINGTETHPDSHWNEKLYGSNSKEDLEAVLSGKVDTFAELLPLYRKIQELTARAGA